MGIFGSSSVYENYNQQRLDTSYSSSSPNRRDLSVSRSSGLVSRIIDTQETHKYKLCMCVSVLNRQSKRQRDQSFYIRYSFRISVKVLISWGYVYSIYVCRYMVRCKPQDSSGNSYLRSPGRETSVEWVGLKKTTDTRSSSTASLLHLLCGTLCSTSFFACTFSGIRRHTRYTRKYNTWLCGNVYIKSRYRWELR